jgi:hypothetical protein
MVYQGLSGQAFACRVFFETVHMLDHGGGVNTEKRNSDECFFFELALIDFFINIR